MVNSRSLAKAMAGDIGCKVNLPLGTVRQIFEFRYFLLGPNFASLGNENLQVNRRGFEVSEEVRLFSGKTTLKGSFEYYRDNLNEVKTGPTRSFDLRLLAMFMWDRRFPYATLTFTVNDDKTRSATAAAPDNRNHLNSAGVSLQYTKAVGISTNSFALSYSNALSTIASEALVEDISLKINTIVLSVNSRYSDSPLATRAQVAGNFSRGQYGVNLASTLLGGRWLFIADALYLDIDFGYDYSRNWGNSAEHELVAKSGLNFDIGTHHTVYTTASLNKVFGTAYISPNARASYEFRF
jgi:hypothetical protein